ncbi:unnamed protein product [Choristocarpus tenellus]
MSIHPPSALRNRAMITSELKRWLQMGRGREQTGRVLEVASGTGCHIEAFAKILPGWTFQPTECDESRMLDIQQTLEQSRLSNILNPKPLDVRTPHDWTQVGGGEVESALPWDAVVAINMIHISPEPCTEGLMEGAQRVLRAGGRLYLYGPFVLEGLLAPESNVVFDATLKARSEGQWGVRDVAWVAKVAATKGMELTAMKAMPSNNFMVIFTKVWSLSN